MKLVLLLLALAMFASSLNNFTSIIWPKPESFSSDPHGKTVKINPCEIQYKIQFAQEQLAANIISWYKDAVFNCESSSNQAHEAYLTIRINDPQLIIPTQTVHQRYTLTLADSKQWSIQADYYPGFVRGFQTFAQLLNKNEQQQWQIKDIPIQVVDGPQFKWRGLMIDSSRHFIPMETIRQAIDSMAFSKLNVLHWHIIDEDSFPMQVPSVPQLSEFGSVGGLISPEDIIGIIKYARDRAIRVVPEIDTPAHTRSWGRSQKYENITLDCNGIYMGQFDPTIDLTWQVVEKVMSFIDQTFDDQYVHFGGDETVHECWAGKQSINDWMDAHNITGDYQALHTLYRQRQKQVWRAMSNKKVIYWANEEVDLPMELEDTIEWWGISANVGQILGRKNPVILANKDEVYLDFGFNNMYGVNNGDFAHWRQAYGFQPRMQNVNVIGGESCIWAENTNRHNFHQKVTQRSAVIGERLWNDQVDLISELNNIATRLTAHAGRLRERGFKVWPVTVGLCEQEMSVCF